MTSNDDAVRASGLERLFAAELAAVLDVPITAVDDDSAGAPPASRARWAMAAAVLFGVLVTWQVAVLREPVPTVQGPDELEPPDPLPIPFVLEAADLTRVSRDTRNLAYTWNVVDEDLTALAPFTALVRLRISGPPRHDELPANLLSPIAALPELEALEVPVHPGVTGAHLRQLAAAPRLRFLTLQLRRPLGTADTEALQTLPQLCSLTLKDGSIDGKTLRSLSLLAHLDVLELAGVSGCTEAVLRELRTLHRLRRIRLTQFGKQPCAERLGARTDEDSVGLTETVAKALAELPLLEEVRLSHCAVSPDAIRCLPSRLTGFALTRCPDADAEVIAAIQHFPGLQRLELDHFDARQRGHWLAAPPPPNPVETGPQPHDPAIEGLPDQAAIHRAQAELMRRLPIARLCFRYSLPDEVAAALSDSRKLTDVELTWGIPADIAAIAKAPALTRLRLNECRYGLGDLRTLNGPSTLRRLDLRWGAVSREAAAAALPTVTVGQD